MPKHVYLDLDGTLTDPFEGISKSILYALERLDAPLPPADSLRRFIGPPLLDTFSELLDESRAAPALELYRERFSDVGWRENVPYDGIHEALGGLQKAGHTLFVATTKPWKFAERIVEYFDMATFFDGVYGSELDGARTDKTELLAWALPKNPDYSRAVMIGDRKHDMIGARNNDMHAVGVTWGYGSVNELKAAGAEQLAHRPMDIADKV
jgi:phosphoglycolate phosphatase